MNHNLISYGIYLIISYFITIHLGKVCHKNGGVYLRNLYPENTAFVDRINNLLLLGFYLLNLGYVTFVLRGWPQIEGMQQMIAQLSVKIGNIMLLLALMHYNNLIMTYLVIRKYKLNHINH